MRSTDLHRPSAAPPRDEPRALRGHIVPEVHHGADGVHRRKVGGEPWHDLDAADFWEWGQRVGERQREDARGATYFASVTLTSGGSASTTRSRPATFARYNAASAARTSVSTVVPCCGNRATPTDTLSPPITRSPCCTCRCLMPSRMSSARLTISSASISGIATTNSSPP